MLSIPDKTDEAAFTPECPNVSNQDECTIAQAALMFTPVSRRSDQTSAAF